MWEIVDVGDVPHRRCWRNTVYIYWKDMGQDLPQDKKEEKH